MAKISHVEHPPIWQVTLKLKVKDMLKQKFALWYLSIKAEWELSAAQEIIRLYKWEINSQEKMDNRPLNKLVILC